MNISSSVDSNQLDLRYLEWVLR